MFTSKPILAAALLLLSAGASYAATGKYLEPASSIKPIVVADARDVVYSMGSGTVARSSSGECIRTKWMNGYDVCSTAAAPAPVVKTQKQRSVSLSREERTVYFDFNKASLKPEMKERLNTLANVLRSDDQVRGARIVGYADRIGNPGYNEKLSKKRAESVRQYLVAKGIINTSVADTRWFGESEPATDCSDDLKRSELIECLQKDRRVEVEIDYVADVHASR
ncbi:MAG: OmpA family protein [Alphaproteobacteria bacterium]